MAEKIYFIKGSTLMAIAHAIRQYGNSYDNMSLAGMPSYISNFKSQAVFDAYISAPSTATATDTAVPSWDFVGRTDSKIIYSIKESSLLNIINALRQAGGFTDLITPADIPLYIKNNFVTQWDINSFVNKTITRIYNTTCTTIGAQAFQGCTQLSYVEFTKATTVGSNAFENCIVLDTLSMPLVTSVNASAFANCKSISYMTIGVSQILSNDAVGVTLIDNPYLQTLNLPNCVLIGDSVCRKCYSLYSLYAPVLTTISQYAFQSCSSLTSLRTSNFPQTSQLTLGEYAFASCVGLTEIDCAAIASVGNQAFQNCTSLSRVTLPNASYLGRSAFQGDPLTYLSASNVTSVYANSSWFPIAGCNDISFINLNKLSLVQGGLFRGRTALQSVILNETTTIYSSAFSGCTNLSNVQINGMTALMSDDIFIGCTKLNENGIQAANLQYINSTHTGAFRNTGFISIAPSTFPNLILVGYNAFQSCMSLKSVHLSTKVTFLGRSAFGQCTNLSYLSAPGVTSVYADSSWFPIAGCNNLSFINLNNLSLIHGGLFRGRTALRSIVINNATGGIFSSAFSGCTNLSDVQINNVTALNSANIFIDCVNLNENGIHATNLQYIASGHEGVFRNTGFISITPSLFPNLLTIGYNAFQSCANLRSVHLSTKVNYLGRSAFGNCTALTYLSAPGVTGVYTTSNYVPTAGCANLEFANFNGLATVPYALFTGLTKLQSVYVNGATTLAQSAFRGCTSLRTVYMNSMVTMGTQSVFENCTALNETGIYASNLASLQHDDFRNTGFTKLTSAAFPKLNYMGHRNFQNCANLSSVNLPLVTYVGQYAFGNCPLLTYVSLPAVTGFYNDSGQNALVSCPNITFANFDGVLNVSYHLFNGRSKLTSVRVNSASRIDQSAFQNCAALTSIVMDKVTDIRSYAFNGCTALSTIYAPALTTLNYTYVFQSAGLKQATSAMFPLLTSITHNVFKNCAQLSSVNLPKVTYLGASAFEACTALTYLSVPAVTGVYTSNANVPTKGCTNLAFANFAALTAIPRYLFTNLQKLSSVVLTNASDIQGYAFQSCNALTSITLPKATLIRSSAFINNTGIKNVQIGSTVSNALALTISAQAFYGCTNLSTISILHTSLATLQNSNAFTGTGITSTTGKIIVPASLYSSYQTRAQWSYFKNVMSTVTF